jgi:stage IV sporulation protein FB
MDEPVNQWEDGPDDADKWSQRSSSALRTLTSLLLYVIIYALLFRDLRSILLLVLVIIVHEGGHFLAMKAFGYTDIKLFFIPFFGALISGEHENISTFRRSLMILAGPIPGIAIGLACLFLGQTDTQGMVFRSGLLFTLLNVFNLLPVKPLDGGQLLYTAFPRYARNVQALFMILTALALVGLCITRRNYLFLLFPAAMLVGTFIRWRRTIDQEPLEPPTETQQLILLLIWLLGLMIPLAAVLFVPGMLPIR